MQTRVETRSPLSLLTLSSFSTISLWKSQEDQCVDPEELMIIVQPVNAHTCSVYPEKSMCKQTSSETTVAIWGQLCAVSSFAVMQIQTLGNMGSVVSSFKPKGISFATNSESASYFPLADSSFRPQKRPRKSFCI